MPKPDLAVLFAHGIGHSKDVWAVAIGQIKRSMAPLSVECASFDLPFHGTRVNSSIPPVSISDDPKRPRYYHPAIDCLDMLVEDAAERAKHLKRSVGQVVAVGHSLGGMVLWLVEIKYPGTFAKVVMFEPVYNFSGPHTDAMTSFMVTSTLQKRSSWPSIKAAIADLKVTRGFNKWHPEAIEAFVKGSAFVTDESSGRVSLALSPSMEAAFQCFLPVVCTPEELAAPRCRVHVHGVARSKMFTRKSFEDMESRWPEIYKLEKVTGHGSHAIIVEDPKLVAKRVVEHIGELEMQNAMQELTPTLALARL